MKLLLAVFLDFFYEIWNRAGFRMRDEGDAEDWVIDLSIVRSVVDTDFDSAAK